MISHSKGQGLPRTGEARPGCARRTGCGKTLAFVLPIVQRLLDGNKAERPEKGRSPRVIVLAPTRELAKQASRPEQAVLRGATA